MEEAHRNHKEIAWDWLAVLTHVVSRIKPDRARATRDFSVTPWSGRSPGGWSA